MLTLYEELQLLAIHDEKGIFIRSAVEPLKPGLAGAMLAELAFADKICTAPNHRLKLKDNTPTNDPILDDVLARLKESEKDRKFGYWINNLNPKPEKLQRLITASLVQKEILTREDDRLQWVVPSHIHPEVKASTKYSVIKLLRGIVLAQEEAHPREIAFLSLVCACELLDLIFLRDERRAANQKINELVVFHAMQNPTLETIQEISSAIASVVEED
jgi:Golgi phosphoprotein 3